MVVDDVLDRFFNFTKAPLIVVLASITLYVAFIIFDAARH